MVFFSQKTFGNYLKQDETSFYGSGTPRLEDGTPRLEDSTPLLL